MPKPSHTQDETAVNAKKCLLEMVSEDPLMKAKCEAMCVLCMFQPLYEGCSAAQIRVGGCGVRVAQLRVSKVEEHAYPMSVLLYSENAFFGSEYRLLVFLS